MIWATGLTLRVEINFNIGFIGRCKSDSPDLYCMSQVRNVSNLYIVKIPGYIQQSYNFQEQLSYKATKLSSNASSQT